MCEDRTEEDTGRSCTRVEVAAGDSRVGTALAKIVIFGSGPVIADPHARALRTASCGRGVGPMSELSEALIEGDLSCLMPSVSSSPWASRRGLRWYAGK